MKQMIVIILLCLITNEVYSQYNDQFLSDFFFGRQPSARAEALGKGYSSIGGDIFSAYYNPAGLSLIKGIELNGNYSSPYYLMKDENFVFTGLGYNLNKYFQIGFSRFSVGYGDITFTDESGNELYKLSPYTTNYSLTFASNPIKNLYLGINTNLLLYKATDNAPFKSLFFDFGVLKTIELNQNDESINQVQLSGSLSNFTFAKMTIDVLNNSNNYELPVISRFGLSYKLGLKNSQSFKNLRTFQALALIEYQNLLNCKYLTAYRFGCEFSIYEILALRFGYYFETVDNSNSPNSVDKIDKLTYGLGINLPLNKLISNNFPLNIKIDYTNLPQPSFVNGYNNWDNFKSVSLSINYRFNTN